MSIAKAFLPTGRASGCHRNDKADEESFDSSSALLIVIFIYSLCKSIRGRCVRL